MRKKLLLLLPLIILGLTVSSCKSAQTDETSTIIFENGTYSPNNIIIKVNQKVSFVNQSDTDIWPASNIHPTHQIYPQFDPQKPIGSGKSWTFAFTKAGIWKFHDHLMPELTGEIRVE